LQTIVRDVEYHPKKSVVALEQKARLGKYLYQTICKDCEILEVDISKALQTLDHVELVIKQVQQQLEHMHLGFGLSTFLVPIVHLCKHDDHDRSVILIKACPICFEWFTTSDIVVASCGHTYNHFCLFTHLQTSVTCVVEFFLDIVLHPDWWRSMGIRPLSKKQKQIVVDFHLVQQQWFQEKINHMQ
jgi:hypothetical protein